MTGKELIQWIIKNHAEDMEILIEHRDGGGTYHTAERLGEFQKPMLCSYNDEMYGITDTLIFDYDKPKAILL